MMSKFKIVIFFTAVVFLNCNKKSGGNNPPPLPPSNFSMLSWLVNGKPSQSIYYDISKTPLVQFKFSTTIDRNSVLVVLHSKKIQEPLSITICPMLTETALLFLLPGNH